MGTNTAQYIRLPAERSTPVFKAGNVDTVVTVEFKNTNQNRVNFKAELLDANNNLVGSSVSVQLEENRSYKKFNVFVKANSTIYVRPTVPGLALKVYKPGLFAIPGQFNLAASESKQVAFNLDIDGTHNFVVKGVPAGITVAPMSGSIVEGVPVNLTITRGATGSAVGQIQLTVPDVGIMTVVDVGFTAPTPVDDGTSNDPDFNADLVAAYIDGRDHVV